MRIIYTALLIVLYPILKMGSRVNKKLAAKINGYNQVIPQKSSKQPVYWFHCASLGEFDMALPVMEELKQQIEGCQIIVTFFSPSGMEHYHKRNHVADSVYYLPYDIPSKLNTFIDQNNPVACFLVKYEFWPNLIYCLNKHNVKTVSICTVLRADQRFFKWWGGLFRKSLGQVNEFYVQTKQTHELLNRLNIRDVEVTGDTRYDRVLANKAKNEANLMIETFLGNEKAIILGSTWQIDEEILIPFLKGHDKKVIIAPHDISANHIEYITELVGADYCLYSSYQGEQCKFLILDTIGLLTSAYKYGTWAYVGGGFSGKLHNILEPAVYGLPVIFGPKHHRFHEAQSFIDHKFGFSIQQDSELFALVNTIESDLVQISARATAFVEENAGASKKIVTHFLIKHSS